jgi:beta-glucosidase
MKCSFRSIHLGLFLLLSAAAGALRAQANLYLDSHAPTEKRVDDLVSRMTLEEKVLQLQHEAPAIPRLQVPAYRWWNESLHGVSRQGYMTVFPQAIGLAATWDRDLLHSVGEAISTEARARHNDAMLPTSRDHKDASMFGLDFWAPNVNIFRDPRWGRGQETYGEDPYLTGELAVEYVQGMQGPDPLKPRAIATPKHYAVHSGPESLRHSFDVDPSPHDLADTYLPAFRAAITAGHADSIMCSYNRIDGAPACANSKFLTQILRDDWKFPGYVVTDCGAVNDFVKGHHYSTDGEHAIVSALKAGVDLLCSSEGEVKLLPDAVKQGLLTEADIDVAVKRLFTARFELGLFDALGSTEYARIPLSEVNSPEHRALALRAAEEAIVLLKNGNPSGNKVLPLSSSVKSIAVIGPNASLTQALEGNYNGTAQYPSRPVDGITEEFAGKAEVSYAQGSSHTSQTPVPIPRNLLRPAADSREFGLKGEYFNNLTLSGTPVLTRIDHEIDFDWDGDTPDPAVHRDTFSVRWSGYITAPGPGTYVISTKFAKRWFDQKGGENEAYRILIDGVAISEGKNEKRPDAPYTFKDTKPHAIQIEYFHDFPRLDGGITVGWIPDETQMRDEAVRLARKSDVVVAVVGLNSYTLEGEEYPLHIPGFSGGDRTNIELPETQVKLLDALAATGKPVVVVLMNGSALAGDWVQHDAAALVEAWYPGEAGGQAIARTLSGANNPAGRLPITFYNSSADLPPFTDYSMQNRTYRYFTGKPLFGFGDGLSYTNFSYSHMKLSANGKPVTRLHAGDPLDVDADVSNVGSFPGGEVAELYLVPLGSKVAGTQPILALRDFQRLKLNAGQTTHLNFKLDPRALSTVGSDGKRSVAPGSYRIVLGSGQPDRATDDVLANFDIVGSVVLPE